MNGVPQQSPDQGDGGQQKDAGWLAWVLRGLWWIRPVDGWQALFNALLVGVGFLQWRVYNRQAKIMGDTREVAVAALGRPYVFFEFISHNLNEWRGGKEHLWLRFQFANYGPAPAVVQAIYAHTFLSPGPDTKGNEDDGVIKNFPGNSQEIRYLLADHGRRATYIVHMNVEESNDKWKHDRIFIVRPGKSSRMFSTRLAYGPIPPSNFLYDILRMPHDEHIFTATEGAYPVAPWLIGTVLYQDVQGRSHHTRFCLRCDADGGATEDGDPSYNERT